MKVLSAENGTFIKNLTILAIPIILQEILNASVNMIDTLMIGKLGIHEVTAVGLANQVFFLFTLLCFGITSGSSIFTGQFYGKEDYNSVHKVMGICFVATTTAAFIFAGGAFFIPRTIMSIYTNDEAVIELGVKYLRVIAVSYFLTAITVSFNAALRSTRQTKIPMFTTMIALVCNAGLNYVFIFIFDMSVAGAAIATVIARMLEISAQFLIIFKLKLPVAGAFKSYFSSDRAFIKTFFATTVPVILNEFFWALGTSIYHIIYKYAGTEGQGAIQIAANIQNIFMVIGMAVGTSCGIMIANFLGAGEIEKAIKYSRKCLALAVVFSACMSGFLLIFSPFVVNFFEVSDVVKENVRNIIFVIAFGMPLKTFNYTTIVGILRSGGDTLFCLILDGGAVWFVGIPLGFLAAAVLHFPIHMILLFVYGEEIAKLFFAGWRTFTNKWARSLV